MRSVNLIYRIIIYLFVYSHHTLRPVARISSRGGLSEGDPGPSSWTGELEGEDSVNRNNNFQSKIIGKSLKRHIVIYRLTTSLENLEMSVNFIAFREM
jgi:hypothetical protein